MSTTIRTIQYRIDDAGLVLAIDTNVLTAEMAAEINKFVSFSWDRLKECDGDVHRVVGRMFAVGAIRYFQDLGGVDIDEDRSNPGDFEQGVLNWFDEGWPNLNHLGIRIVSAYVPTVEFDELEEEELEGDAS